MKRREVIKGLGLSLGALLVAPSAMSLLQSCTSDKPTWVPGLFSEDQARLLDKLADIILPKSEDSPSATEVNVPEFIDKYVAEVFEVEERDLFVKGYSNFGNIVMKNVNAEVLADIESTDIEPALGSILRKSKEEDEAIMKTFYEAIDNEAEIPEDVLNYVTMNGVRDLCIFAYTNSEKVGEEVMAYVPVPGKQEGCIDISETDGKAYSL
ncbi:gluconate 2-dehydrogenase subunit 3 family protein [uncultured Winogradskyella sp.]|uniref:gluconate 2-dehydrogenase subunit 3 family protein n=1 Tax=uncultured Winogradskyella sp. TaxID=395353 RepID=UPI00261E75EC|nr:gluconate 2-dehydrogenase subunit 3 family protein [uncultured Winogradskyella sp.]